MSTVYLLPDDPAYDAVGFDVTTQENHEETSALTTNPIEDGRQVTDHIIHAPHVFSCEVAVAEKGHQQNFYADATAETQTIKVPNFMGFGIVLTSAIRVKTLVWREGSRVLEMQDRLTALRIAGVTMTVLTMTREYEAMVLTSIAIPRGPNEKGIGKFSLQFHELVTVQTATVQAPAPKEPRAVPASSKGAQGSKPIDLANDSLLLKGAQAFSSWIK